MPSFSKGLLLSLLSAALLLSGCNNRIDTDKETSDNLSYYGDSTEDIYEDAVSSLSEYFSFLATGWEEISYLEDNLDAYQDGKVSYAEYGYGPTFFCYFGPMDDTGRVYDDLLDASEELDAERIAAINEQVQTLRTTFDDIESACTDMDAYTTAEDYVLDNFAEGDALYARMDAGRNTFYEIHDSLYAEVSALLDEALVDYIDEDFYTAYRNMQDELSLMSQMMDIVKNAKANKDNSQADELLSLYESLQSANEEHRELTLSTEYYHFYPDYYRSFLDEAEVDFLPVVKRTQRNLESADYDSTFWDYSELLYAFNGLKNNLMWYLEDAAY